MADKLALQTFEEDLVQIEDRLLLSYEKRDLIVTDENKRRKRLQIFENLKSLKAALRKEIEFQFKCNFCDYRAKQLKVSQYFTVCLGIFPRDSRFRCSRTSRGASGGSVKCTGVPPLEVSVTTSAGLEPTFNHH